MESLDTRIFKIIVYLSAYSIFTQYKTVDPWILLALMYGVFQEIIKIIKHFTNNMFGTCATQSERVLIHTRDIGWFIETDRISPEGWMLVMKQDQSRQNFVTVTSVDVPAGFCPEEWLADAIGCPTSLVQTIRHTKDLVECSVGTIKIRVVYFPDETSHVDFPVPPKSSDDDYDYSDMPPLMPCSSDEDSEESKASDKESKESKDSDKESDKDENDDGSSSNEN